MFKFIGIKDLNLYIVKLLDDKSLFHLNQSCKYFHNLLNDDFYSKRYYEKYGHLSEIISKNIDRKTYFQTYKYIHVIEEKLTEQKNTIKQIRESVDFAISNDRNELLCLIYHFAKLKTRKYFIIDYEYPIELAIKKDAVLCFNFLYKIKKQNLNNNWIYTAIEYKSDKFLEYIKDQMILSFDSKKINHAFLNNSPKYIEIMKPYISDEILDDFFYYISYPCSDIRRWQDEYNSSFDCLIKFMSPEQIKRARDIALQRDCHDVIKLITRYTSRFFKFN